MNVMTVRQWQDKTGATGEPDDAMGDPLSLDAIITISDDAMSYCVGHPNGNETWMNFDGSLCLAAINGEN